jgi:hypothetical protein
MLGRQKEKRIAWYLSKLPLEVLREYYKEYRRKNHFSEGVGEVTTAHEVPKRYFTGSKLKWASLKEAVSTHLDTDMQHIFWREEQIDAIVHCFLDHNNLKTTMRYTPVSRIKVEMIGSPLDRMPW